MADEMDPCECIWNHELAMRRLISLLRQGQSYCTDSDCLEDVDGMPAASAGNSFLTMFLMMAFAVAMYALRPRTAPEIQDAKPPRNPQDHDDGAPPTPPRI